TTASLQGSCLRVRHRTVDDRRVDDGGRPQAGGYSPSTRGHATRSPPGLPNVPARGVPGPGPPRAPPTSGLRGARHSPRPASRAFRAASVRVGTSSLLSTVDTWLRTVLPRTCRRLAISALLSPRARSESTSRSRAVRSAKGSAAPLAPAEK